MTKKNNEKSHTIAVDDTQKSIKHTTKTVESIAQIYATHLSLIALLSSATPAKVCVAMPSKTITGFVEALARLTGRTIMTVESHGNMSDIGRVERVVSLHKKSELVIEIYDEDGASENNRTIFIEKTTGYTAAHAEEVVSKAFRSRIMKTYSGVANGFADSINLCQLIIDGENGGTEKTFTWIEPAGCGAKKGEYSVETLVISA